MIKKTENCLYCGEKMESVTAKKKFCSDLHRVYWNRENKKPLTTVAVIKEVAKRMGKEAAAVTTLDVTQRIAKIEELLKLPDKYLPVNKRSALEKELSELKSNENYNP